MADVARFAHFTDGNAAGLYTADDETTPVSGYPTGAPEPPITATEETVYVYEDAFFAALLIHPPEMVWPGATPII